MGWFFLAATVLLAAPPLTLSKGAFVGVFTPEGQSLPFSPPSGEQWVSYEQVQRELKFRGWSTPLKNSQMAELAKALEADFAVDVLVATVRVRRGWEALLAVRVVSATLGEIVHLPQTQTKISNPDELPQVVEKFVAPLLAKFPLQVPIASVQLRESGKRVHLTATAGEWKKGAQLLFFRESEGRVTSVGKGRVVAANLLIGGSRWLLEAELTETNSPVRSGDKAVRVFALPKPFEVVTP